MRRTLALLTLLALAALGAGCGDYDPNTTNTTNMSFPSPSPSPDKLVKKQDQITIQYPNIFLQGDKGKVTFQLEAVWLAITGKTTVNGNNVVRETTNISDKGDPNHDIHVEVRLLTTGLVKTDLSKPGDPYTGSLSKWEWELEPAAELVKGSKVSLRFQVAVTLKAKTPGLPDEDKGIVWEQEYSAEVGAQALFIKGAAYAGSPALGLAGLTAVVKGRRRRRKDLLDGETEEDGIEDQPKTTAIEMPGAPSGMVAPGGQVEDEVSGTVYAPEQARPGDGFLVQVFVHLPEQAASLDELAKEADEDARRRISNKLQKKIKRGTELTFHLVMPGLEVDTEVQSCIWNGEPSCIQFGVTVPEDCKPKNIFGTVTVSENTVPIGHLKFKFKITGEAASEAQAAIPEPAQPVANMVRYHQAFISYASKDRQEVLKRVQMLNVAKIKFFQDLLTLEPGDEWEKLLYEYIDKSDVFFLFWSTAASQSEWVRKEVEYAIKRKGDSEMPDTEIIPVIIEGPPPAKPPAELSFLHFNDKLIYFINTRETETKQPES